MAKPSDEVRWSGLRDSLIVLAADPVDQLNWIGAAHPDELALSFDDARRLVLGLSTPSTVSADLLDLIETIDSEFDALSTPGHSELWTPEAVCEDETWALIRGLAQAAVSLWPDRP